MALSDMVYGNFKKLVENKVKNSFNDYIPPDIFLKYTNLCIKKLHGLSGVSDFEDYFTSKLLSVVGHSCLIDNVYEIDRIKTAISEAGSVFTFVSPEDFYSFKGNLHFQKERFFCRENDVLIFYNAGSSSYGNIYLKYYRLPYNVTSDSSVIDIKGDMIDSLLDFVTYKILQDQKGQIPQALSNSVNELLQVKNAKIEEKPNRVRKEVNEE